MSQSLFFFFFFFLVFKISEILLFQRISESGSEVMARYIAVSSAKSPIFTVVNKM